MSIKASIDHFRNAFQSQIHGAYAALNSGDSRKFSDIVASVSNSGLVQSISARLTSAHDNFLEFKRELKQLGPFGDLIFGLTTVVIGAAFWTSGMALGPIIGFALIAIGIMKAVPAAHAMVLNKMKAEAESSLLGE